MVPEQLLMPVLFGLSCACVGVVVAYVLPGEDTPLNRLFLLLSRTRERGGWRSWVASPLGACEKCTAGQLALWGYSIVVPWSWDAASIAGHVFAACWAVLFALPIRQATRWTKNQM